MRSRTYDKMRVVSARLASSKTVLNAFNRDPKDSLDLWYRQIRYNVEGFAGVKWVV